MPGTTQSNHDCNRHKCWHRIVHASPHLTQLKTEMWTKHQCLSDTTQSNHDCNRHKCWHHTVHASPYLTQLKTEMWMKHQCLKPHNSSFTVLGANASARTQTRESGQTHPNSRYFPCIPNAGHPKSTHRVVIRANVNNSLDWRLCTTNTEPNTTEYNMVRTHWLRNRL